MYSLETDCQNLLTKASFTVFKQLITFVDDEPLHATHHQSNALYSTTATLWTDCSPSSMADLNQQEILPFH